MLEHNKIELLSSIKERIMQNSPEMDPNHAEDLARRWVSKVDPNLIRY